MNLKSFSYGLACGALAGAVIAWIILGRTGTAVAVTPVAESPVAVTAASAEWPTVSAPRPEGRSAAGSEVNSAADTQSPNTEPSVTAAWPASVWADVEREPKDDSWAYYMEQALLQFLGAHPEINQFDISRIECRTSVCQIEVTGFDESTVPVWTQLMYDIQQEPWSEFGEYGSSSGLVDGRVVLIGTLRREPPPD